MAGRRRRGWWGAVLLALLVLLASACAGGGSGDTSDVAAVLEEAASTQSYRAEVAVGQVVDVPSFGMHDVRPLNPGSPVGGRTVTSEGTYVWVDMSHILAWFGSDIDGVSYGFQVWADDRRAVFDTTDFGALEEISPATYDPAAFGPFHPGVWSVDLSGVEITADEAVRLLGGTEIDPVAMAGHLAGTLEGVAEVESGRYAGTVAYGEVLMAQGGDLEVAARSAAGPVAQGFGLDVDELTALYVDAYEQVDAEVVISLGADGGLESLRTEVDMLPIMRRVLDAGQLVGVESADLASARRGLDDAVFDTETLVSFEADDGLELPPVPEPTEDRTEEFLVYSREIGLIDPASG